MMIYLPLTYLLFSSSFICSARSMVDGRFGERRAESKPGPEPERKAVSGEKTRRAGSVGERGKLIGVGRAIRARCWW